MNAYLQTLLSIFIIAQLCASSFIPHEKMKNNVTSKRQKPLRNIFSNFIDGYEVETTSADVISRTCTYYNYEDECHNTNDGCGVQTVSCSVNDSPGCYTVWSGNQRILQGCWLPSSRQDCTLGNCVSKEGQLLSKLIRPRTYFCCCFGDHCNKNYGISNYIPESWN